MKGHKIKVKKLTPDGEIVAVYPSMAEAARDNYISKSTMQYRCYGITKKPFALDGHNYQFITDEEYEEFRRGEN